MRRGGIIVAVVFLLTGPSSAGELASMFGAQRKALDVWPVLGGALQQVEDTPATEETSPGTSGKSPKKALFLSALVPGTGELYLGAWKRGALFLGLEAVAWGLYFSWDSKGNDIEDEFRVTADQEWNPNDYLAWLDSGQSRFSSITHELPCEEYVKNTGGLGDCADSEVQQYYELIGKYDQFVVGWSDLSDQNGNRVEPSQVDSVENFQSTKRLDYEDRRNDSNTFLKRASNLSGLILVNHVLSAIDAARASRARARGVEEVRLERRTRFMVAMQPGSRGQVPMLLAYKPF
jgi:hypothetical protein